MPELPEVETVRQALEKLVRGRGFSQVKILRRDYLQTGKELLPQIAGGMLQTVNRRGKFLALHLSNGLVLVHHLGMSGRLLLTDANSPCATHTHLRIVLDDGAQELRQRDPRRFGFVAVLRSDALESYPPWSNLGVEPFDLNPQKFYSFLKDRKRPIKSFLLDQHFVAGLGNIYTDESLYRARIHPTRNCCDLAFPESKLLLRQIKTVLKASIRAGGTSTNDYRQLDGTLGDFQNHLRVYGRDGYPCPQCGETIQRIVIGGRSAHVCGKCQK